MRSLLLAQLKSTHNKADWFVPLNAAIAGLTPEQAKWIPKNAAGKLVRDLDAVLTSLEHFVEGATNSTLITLAPKIANLSTHNPYHTGQIIYVRKLQGSWNPDTEKQP